MAKTTVVHVNDPDGYDIYVGRAVRSRGLQATIWGNPFRIGRDGTRDEVIEKYRAWLIGQPKLVALARHLRGLRIACWCKPQACHGDVLAEIADSASAVVR